MSEAAGAGRNPRSNAKATIQGMPIPGFSRRDLELLAVGASRRIASSTRLQKILFLFAQEHGEEPACGDFEFKEGVSGPWSLRVCDDLEFLDNLGFVHAKAGAEATAEEAFEVDRLRYAVALGVACGYDESVGADHYQTQHYVLSAKGEKRVAELEATRGGFEAFTKLRRIVERTEALTLRELIEVCGSIAAH